MTDLIPVFVRAMDRWNLDGVDPYFVCKYSGTTKVVTFQGIGAKICEGGGSWRRGDQRSRQGDGGDDAAWLERHGLQETEASITSKLARGTFAATFMLAVMAAREMDVFSLGDL